MRYRTAPAGKPVQPQGTEAETPQPHRHHHYYYYYYYYYPLKRRRYSRLIRVESS
jgi:hypothetical protein